MSPRPAMSRWKRSEVSFGPVGRVLASLVVLVPLWWGGVGWVLGSAIWALFVVPLAMRDIWKRVPDRDKPPILELPAEIGAPAPGESIHDRRPPTRW